MSKNSASKKKKRKKKKQNLLIRIFKYTFALILSVAVLSLVAFMGVALAVIKSSPKLDVNQILNLNETSMIYDNKSNHIDDVLVTDENNVVIKRTVVQLKDMPKTLSNAFISIEDERFEQHHGYDLKRIAGVFYIDIKNKITKKSNTVQGASTITQQLIKNKMFLADSQTNRLSLKRKLQEIYLASELENYLTKNQILEAYLNTIFLGGNAHGVEAASNQYFNKSAKDLSLIECAFLAGINQSPSTYYPFSTVAKKNPDIYLNRTKTVLLTMYKNKKITKSDYDKAISDINNKKLVFNRPSSNTNSYAYEWFSRPLVEQVKQDLKTQYKYSDTEIANLFIDGGLKIYSTMDKNMQDSTQQIITNDEVFKKATNDSGKHVEPQASAVLVDYHTGQVKAIVGGRGSQPANSYNRADSTKFLRATGSSIKPLTVYSAALESKQATAATVIDDSPLPDDVAKKYLTNGEPYQPKNDGTLSYSGPRTIRDAIRESINVIAVKLEDKISLKTGAEFAQKYGITLDSSDTHSISALALGELHHGANPMIMASAYGVFGNSGVYTTPTLYTKVVDKSGKVLLQNKLNTRKILSEQNSYIMYDLLKGPVGNSPNTAGATGTNANIGDMPVAGKTGTSSDSKNLWFCGLSPYYSCAVWIGNDDWSRFYGLGSNDSAGLWGKIMKMATNGLQVKDITAPSGVVTCKVCADSGELPTSSCPNVRDEIFADDTVPTALCSIHSYSTDGASSDNSTTSQTTTTEQMDTTGQQKKNEDSSQTKKTQDTKTH